MTNTQEVLQSVEELSQHNLISRGELLAAFEAGKGHKKDQIFTKKVGMTELLYYLGGAVILLGILALFSQQWSLLELEAKLTVTLGTGIATYIIGWILNRDERTEIIASVCFLLFSFVTPLGFWVIFEAAGLDLSSSLAHSLASGIMLLISALSYYIHRKNIFTLFIILFGTWFYFSFTQLIFGAFVEPSSVTFILYKVFLMGAVYIGLGYLLSKRVQAPLRGFLYTFGSFGFLGAAFALSGSPPTQNIVLEVLYPFFVFGILYLSVRLKSMSFLISSTLFFMAFIIKITFEYFPHSLGWPLALVITGLDMIGVSYLSILLKQRFFKT